MINLGHDIGDGLLRRVGNILNQAIMNTAYTASNRWRRICHFNAWCR